MTLLLQKKLKKEIKDTSRRLGITERDVVDRALLLYIESVKKITDLHRESDAWDALGDEAFRSLSRRTKGGL